MKEFADKKPVILINLVNDWDLKYLNEKFGEQEVVIRKSDYEGKKKVYTVKLSKFIQLLEGGNEENWYCDWPFPIMGNKEIALSYNIPSFLTEQTVGGKGDKELKWYFWVRQTLVPHYIKIFKQHTTGMRLYLERRNGYFLDLNSIKRCQIYLA